MNLDPRDENLFWSTWKVEWIRLFSSSIFRSVEINDFWSTLLCQENFASIFITYRSFFHTYDWIKIHNPYLNVRCKIKGISYLVSDCMSPFLYWYIGRRYNNWYATYHMQTNYSSLQTRPLHHIESRHEQIYPLLPCAIIQR